RGGSSARREAPGVKIDGGYKGPGFAFRKPQRLIDLIEQYGVDNVLVTASTAEARMVNVQRIEYRLVCECGQAIMPDGYGPEFAALWRQYYPGNDYGPTLYQLSDDGEGGEEWLRIFQFLYQVNSESSDPMT